LAVSTYPFEPQAATLNFVTLLVGVAIVSGTVTFAQASRDEILSLIQNTTPNHVSWNASLVHTLATYVGIPLLAALSSQLPILGRLVSTIFSAVTTH
jgi:uncharacterized iron-regulated membrane protein